MHFSSHGKYTKVFSKNTGNVIYAYAELKVIQTLYDLAKQLYERHNENGASPKIKNVLIERKY